MKNTQRDWIYFDKLFTRITLVLFAGAFVLFGILLLILDYVGAFADYIIAPLLGLMTATAVLFFIHLFRIFKFFIKRDKLPEEATIFRSVIGILLNPVAFVAYYILIFIVGLASCSA